jgi:uncharacterized membrane protein YccC
MVEEAGRDRRSRDDRHQMHLRRRHQKLQEHLSKHQWKSHLHRHNPNRDVDRKEIHLTSATSTGKRAITRLHR